MTHFNIIVAGYNCYDYIRRCTDSIAHQNYTDYSVCLVDDASTDERQSPLVKDIAMRAGWSFLQRDVNAGALRSQHEGITIMDPRDGEVIVWVDMDDALAHPDSLGILNLRYHPPSGVAVPMTYGSYQSVPPSPTCPPVLRYPEECEQNNDYRNLMRWGIRYNHARTVKWDLYKHLTFERDFSYGGDWMHLASDAAVMVPCLEMSGGEYKVIEDIIYNYSSDNPISEWRKAPQGTDKMHAALMKAPKREKVSWT